MGALHEGHLGLFRLARREAGPLGCVSVSVFINPTQFNEMTDFETYPRDLDRDLEFCEAEGVDVVFAPPREVVYPSPDAVPVGVLPSVATDPGLEDAFRPGHFAGVCQVVRRLFELVLPEAAVFGEKDWQQTRVITAMAESEALGVRIVAGETAREPDGLAMSSRNRRLSGAERAAAAAIPRALCEACATKSPAEAEQLMGQILEHGGLRTEYACIRDAETLLEPCEGRRARALIAARAGSVRLIDNAPWRPIDPGRP